MNKKIQERSPGWRGSVDGVRPANQGVIGLILNQGTCLGCRPGPQWEAATH